MADSFFDGTFDDFLDDQDLLELASLVLPLGPPSPPRFLGVAPIRANAQEARQFSGSGLQRGIGDRPSVFNSSRVREPSALSSDNFGALGSGPTRPAATNSPSPGASPHSEHSRLNIASRNNDNIGPLAFHSSSPLRNASAFPAPSDSSRSPSPHLHGLPNLAASSPLRHRSRSDVPPNERHPRDSPDVSIQRRRPHRSYPGDAAVAVLDDTAPGFPRHHSDDTSILGSPTMSSTARTRNIRTSDLTFPTARTQTSPPPRSSSRNPRRSTSRPLQPEQGSSTSKRKREAGDDDLFGDDLFADAQVVDLVDKDEVPAEILKSQEDDKNYVKLSTFDCVICMDSVKDLTVTHCGHLFCSACLFSALNMDQNRRICPICRQKIDRPSGANGKFSSKAKGFYPLELKLMTRRTLGRKSSQSSQGV